MSLLYLSFAQPNQVSNLSETVAICPRFGVVTGYYTFEPAIRKHFEGQGQSQLPASPSIYLSKTGSKATPEQRAAPTGGSKVDPQDYSVTRAAE